MTVPTITDDLIAELEGLAHPGYAAETEIHGVSAGLVRALLAERAELKRERNSRVPAGFYRELVALRILRDQVKAYTDRYLLDEIEDVKSCVSEDQHLSASALSECLMDAFEAHWDAAMQEQPS